MSFAKIRLNASSSAVYSSLVRGFTLRASFSSSSLPPPPPTEPQKSTLEDHLNYCASIVEQRDYESYLATRLLPVAKQARVFPVLALNAEVAIIRQKILRNSGVTGIYQLQFWKDALNTLAGQMRGPVPRQPVVRALQHLGVVNAENVLLFQELVNARQETLGDRPFASVDKLEANARSIHGNLIRLVARQLADRPYETNHFDDAADNLGIAVGVATLLRATIPLLKEGVVLLPVDMISLHGLTPDSFFRSEIPGAFKGLLKDLCKMVEHRTKKARSKLPNIDVSVRPAFLSAGVRIDHVLGSLKSSDYNILVDNLQRRPTFVASTLWWRHKRKRY